MRTTSRAPFGVWLFYFQNFFFNAKSLILNGDVEITMLFK